MNVDELVAREEIRDVVKRLARGTDRLDAELIVSCYHPDGFDDHNVFRGSRTEFAPWVLDTLDGDVAQVDTYCVAQHLSKPDADGTADDMVLGLRYVDRTAASEPRVV